RLRQAGAQDEMLRGHRDWGIRFAHEAALGFVGQLQPWGRRLRDEQDNVRQALEGSFERGDSEPALRSAATPGYQWFTMGHPEASGWVKRALDQAADAPDRLRAGALLTAGMLAQNALDHDRALSCLRDALTLFRRVGGRRGEGWTLLWLGRAAMAVDVEARAASSWFEEALCRFREIGDPTGIGWCLVFLGDDAHERGDLEAAWIRATEAQACGAEAGARQVVLESKRVLGLIATRRGAYAEAEQLLAGVAAAYREADDRWQLASALGCMG